MSRIHTSDEHCGKAKGVENSLERDNTKWKRQENVKQKTTQQQQQQQKHVTFIPIACATTRPSYLEDNLGQCGRSKWSNRYNMTSSSGVACRNAKLSNAAYHSDSFLCAGSPQNSSSSDDIINTRHGFTIQLDAKHFQPRDIHITLHQQTLNIIGDRFEDNGTVAQKLRRSFMRSYRIPRDVQLSSISSYLTNNGCLIIKGSRKGWKETDLTKHLASSLISKESYA